MTRYVRVRCKKNPFATLHLRNLVSYDHRHLVSSQYLVVLTPWLVLEAPPRMEVCAAL